MHVTRRNCLKAMGGTLGAALGGASLPSPTLAAQVSSKADASKLSMPGPFRGRVVAVEHPESIISDKYQAAPVQQMMRKGMTDLTGTGGWVDAWRIFAQPGDVVGIKVNPVGQPHVISAAEVVREIIAGLNAAGIKNQDIVVYDRYHDQFFKAGFDKWLPEGVRTSSAAKDYEEVQQGIEGYDPDHYMDMALTLPGYDLSNLTARRSYAALFITKQVNKLINLPVLKDHQSAGVTLALKNLSHGLVNNVCRSHSSSTLNACGSFIPSVVSMDVIRNKTVLHILDGVKGLYHGGPGARPQFVWEHKTLYFASDPVALDHVCWKVIDEKRAAMGMKTIAEDRPDKFSTFLSRQPEHVEIAGALGLGEWNESKIDLQENPALTYYDDLGLPATASDEEIREAYLHLVRLLHPDLQRETSLKRFADYQMKRVSRAYSVLSDPARRERYDAEVARRGETEVSPAGAGRTDGRSRARAWITLGWLICACAGSIGIGWYMSEHSGAPPTEVRAAPSTRMAGAVVPAATAPAPTPVAANNPATPTSTDSAVTGSTSAEPNPAESKPADPSPATANATPTAGSSPPADPVELESLRSELAAAKTEHERARSYIALQHKQLDLLADRILAGPPKVPKGFAGVWVLPKASSFSAGATYAPSTADLIVIENASGLQGRYRARYPTMGRPDPTILRFYFEGKSESDVANLSWKGDGGAKGDVQLRLVSPFSLELVWSATEMGKESGPGSGTVLLMRRREP